MGQNTEVCVYIIVTHYGTFYTGITNSLIRRWKEHSTGRSSYLSRFKPKEVVFMYEFETRRQAFLLERYIKRIGAKRFMLNIKFKGWNMYNRLR